MREIRQSGSEGGGAETNRLSLPLLQEALETWCFSIQNNLIISHIKITWSDHIVRANGS
jgi:hypothetical protein